MSRNSGGVEAAAVICMSLIVLIVILTISFKAAGY